MEPSHEGHWVALEWCHDCGCWADGMKVVGTLNQRDPGDGTY